MPEKNLKELIEELGKTFEEFKKANDARIKELEEKGTVDPLLSEKVEKINTALTDISNMKKQVEQLETVAARGIYPGGDISELETAKKDHRAAFEKWFRKGVDLGLKDLEIKAALSTDSDPDSGFLVPSEMEQAIERVAETVSAMRRIANVITIGTNEYKKLVSQGGAGSGWVGEKAARTETDTPTLKEIAINTKEVYANPAATQGTLDDSRISIDQWLADEVVIAFNDQESSAFISGNGVEKPRGILGYPVVANASYAWGSIGYILSGHASLIDDPDALIDLQHALKSVYRNGSVYLMADSTQGAIRKLKDGEGVYIWRPGLEPGAPNTLLAKPVEIDDNMPIIAGDAYAVAYGNFRRGYLIVDRIGVRVLRDPYSNKPYVHFYTTKRVGGGIVMYEAIKLLKVAAA